jgi:hypothetical protein
MLNVLLYKLNVGLSLSSTLLMSLSGDYIYVCIKPDEQDLKRTAETSETTMQLSIGVTDLTSLEPCDKYYRPFRKCESYRDSIFQMEKQLEEYFAIVEGNIENINNKK